MSSGYDTPDPSDLLPTFNRHDMADRLQLSDAMDERGRHFEARLLRDRGSSVYVQEGLIVRDGIRYFLDPRWNDSHRLFIYAVRISELPRFRRLFPWFRRLTAKQAMNEGYYALKSAKRKRRGIPREFIGGKSASCRNVHQAIGCALAHTEFAMRAQEAAIARREYDEARNREREAAQAKLFQPQNGDTLG